MKKSNRILALLLIVAAAALATTANARELQETATLRETVSPASGAVRLIVDNVWGSITIRGHESSSIEMVAHQTIRARTPQQIELAKQEVELEISERDGEVELYVNGPFRCPDRQQRWECWNTWKERYTVRYDFEIRVPRTIALAVSTVNDGDIEVSDVQGDFEVHNVNGSIDLEGMAGSGEAVTVNGPVVASFVANPSGDTHFETINGKIDVSFQPGLSADLELVARWGDLWSEYEVEPLPSLPPTKRTKGGKTIIEVQKSTRVRVSKGGPVHSFETLNGDIYVRKGTS